jgi:hypothetical protein
VPTEALAQRAGRVVANLPFGSTAAILRWLLGDPRSRLERADLIVQEQAARRYAAVRPGTPERIIWGAWYQLSIGRRLGPGCFRPPPRVGAATTGGSPGWSRAPSAFLKTGTTWEEWVGARRIGEHRTSCCEGDRWGR